jgi:chromosome segregation ATPase
MEEKKYSVVGRVEIGTDEYRDLISEKFESQKQMEYYRDKYWDEQKVTNELKKEVETLHGKLAKLESILKKNTININDDCVSVIMSMFGED